MKRRALAPALVVVTMALALVACGGGSGSDANTTTPRPATTTSAASPTAPTTTAGGGTTTTSVDGGEAKAFTEEFAGAGFTTKEAACLGKAAAALTPVGEAPTLLTEIRAFRRCAIADARLRQLGLLAAVTRYRSGVRTALIQSFVDHGATKAQAACIVAKAGDVLRDEPVTPANRHLLTPAIEACGLDPADLGS